MTNTALARHHRASTTSITTPRERFVAVFTHVWPLDEGRWYIDCYAPRVLAIRTEMGKAYTKEIPFGTMPDNPNAYDSSDDLHGAGWRFEGLYVREVPIILSPIGTFCVVGDRDGYQILPEDHYSLVECVGQEEADKEKLESALRGRLTSALMLASESDWSASVYGSGYDHQLHPANARLLIEQMEKTFWPMGGEHRNKVYPPSGA
jgi:hypothetical protein